MNDRVIRKRDTNEPTPNLGHFGSKRNTASADGLLTSQRTYTVREDTRDHVFPGPADGIPAEERIASELALMGVDESLVEYIDLGWNYTVVRLAEPHPTGGYTEVKHHLGDPSLPADEDNWNVVFYTGAGVTARGNRFTGPQRLDGPSRFSPRTGWEMVEVNGEHIPDPAPELGLHFQGVTNGVLRWTSGSGHYETTRDANGTTTHRMGGDIHRSGAPAVIHADGTEEWWIHGRQVPDPRPQPDHQEVVSPGTPHETVLHTGAKFDPSSDVRDIAVQVRADLDHARNTGLLPKHATISVKIGRAAQADSITVVVGNLEKGTVWSPTRFSDDSWYSASGQAQQDLARDITDQYNYRETGALASNTRTKFYTNVTIAEAD